MKNATKHADALKSLCKKLTKDHKSVELVPQEPLMALVRGAMLYEMSDERADEVMRVIEREFVDLNELRVATDLEIEALLGAKYPKIEKRVNMVTLALNHIFEKEHTLSLDRLKVVSKRDARQFLHALPEIHPYVEAYVMMYAFDGHAFPIDDDILAVLKDHEIVEGETPLIDAQKFVEHQLKADETYEFYLAIRKKAADQAGKSGGAAKKKVKA